MTPDVNVHLLDFPNYGKEMVVKNEDDTYTILINAKLSHDAGKDRDAFCIETVIIGNQYFKIT